MADQLTAPEQGMRETVRDRYAAAARAAAADPSAASCGSGDTAGSGCGCAPAVSTNDRNGTEVFGSTLYDDQQAHGATRDAIAASLGCGVPTAVAELLEGETVLDLGSGAGADVLIAAERVGPTGTAIGLDMTDEMLALARRNARQAGVTNVRFHRGYIEAIPLPDASVDVVISNCVINLAADKLKVLAEAARVLRPGGRFAVSDVIADTDMDQATREDLAQWTGCVAGALTHQQFAEALRTAGMGDIQITTTHRVHEHAASAIIRARKPR